ncbi:hypothetical protein Tco_1220015 [Tanacetum coccineum]
MPPTNNGSTEDVQPPVVQIQTRNPNPESNATPVVTPVPKASIPFPSQEMKKKLKEKATDQIRNSIVYTDHSAIKYLFAKKDAKAEDSIDVILLLPRI